MNNVIDFADYVEKNSCNSTTKKDQKLNSKQEWQVAVIKHLYSYVNEENKLSHLRFKDVLKHIQLSMISAEILAECNDLFDGHSIKDIINVIELTQQFSSKMYLEQKKFKGEKNI